VSNPGRLIAPGPIASQAIALLPNCGRMFVVVTITPLTGVPNPGRPDSAGHYLHLLYRVAEGDGPDQMRTRTVPGSTSTDARAPFEVEFDGGSHALNFEGGLYLSGGSGQYEVSIDHAPLGHREPHWHWLVTISSGGAVPIPRHHQRVGAQVPVSASINAFGVTLDHETFPSVSGVVNGLVPGVPFISGWFG